MKNEVQIPNLNKFLLSDQNSHFYSFQKCVHQHDNPFVSFRVSSWIRSICTHYEIRGAKRKIKFELELHTENSILGNLPSLLLVCHLALVKYIHCIETYLHRIIKVAVKSNSLHLFVQLEPASISFRQSRATLKSVRVQSLLLTRILQKFKTQERSLHAL